MKQVVYRVYHTEKEKGGIRRRRETPVGGGTTRRLFRGGEKRPRRQR